MASSDSGPTWTACTRSSAKADTMPRGSSSAPAPRTAVIKPTGSSFRRRTTNWSTRTEGRSIHWTSSTATTTGEVEADRPGGIPGRPGTQPAGRPARPNSGTARGPPRGPGAAARAPREVPPRGRARGGHRGRRTTGASPPRPGGMRACGSAEAEHPPAPPSKRWSCRCRDHPTRARRLGQSGSSPGSDGGSRARTRAR